MGEQLDVLVLQDVGNELETNLVLLLCFLVHNLLVVASPKLHYFIENSVVDLGELDCKGASLEGYVLWLHEERADYVLIIAQGLSKHL